MAKGSCSAGTTSGASVSFGINKRARAPTFSAMFLLSRMEIVFDRGIMSSMTWSSTSARASIARKTFPMPTVPGGRGTTRGPSGEEGAPKAPSHSSQTDGNPAIEPVRLPPLVYTHHRPTMYPYISVSGIKGTFLAHFGKVLMILWICSQAQENSTRRRDKRRAKPSAHAPPFSLCFVDGGSIN